MAGARFVAALASTFALACALHTTVAAAAPPAPSPSSPSSPSSPPPLVPDDGSTRIDEPFVEKPKPEPDPFGTKPGYLQIFGTAFVGQGLRFNNPYRLATPLGDDAESLSRTATYVDLGFGLTFGNPLGLQHGGALRTSAAVEGVGQVVMTPSYLAWRRWRAIALFGRAGFPIVLTPAATWGFEAGLGATYFFLGGIGVAAEIVGDVFYGAGTRDKATVTYPVLSGQLGFVVAYEVLP